MKNVLAGLVILISLFGLAVPPTARSRAVQNLDPDPSLPTRIELTDRSPNVSVSLGPISGFGDFNGDGLDDLLLSVTPPLLDLVDGGIIFGSAQFSAVATRVIDRVDLSIKPEVFSFQLPRFLSLHPLKDLNRDGCDEIAADLLNVDGRDGTRRAANFIFNGSPGLIPGEVDIRQLVPAVTILKPLDAGRGSSPSLVLTGSGDVNGDGARDLIFNGQVPLDGTFVISILLGPFEFGEVIDLQNTPPDVVINAGAFSSQVNIADVNGDGISDLLVPRPRASRLDIVIGSNRLQNGTTISLPEGGADAVISDLDPRPLRSESTSAGDVNGDGIDDILIGVPNRELPSGAIDFDFPGEVYIVFGSHSIRGRTISITAGEQDVTIRGARGSADNFSPGDSFGASVFSADVNGDGISDVLADAPFGGGPKNKFRDSGAAYVILGSTELTHGTSITLANEQQDLFLFIEEREARLGLLLGPFDLNGDGSADIGYTIRRPAVPPPPPDSLVFDRLDILLGGPISAPQITSAKFKPDAGRLVISGENFNGAMQVEINGELIDRPAVFQSDKNRLVVDGSRRQLGLHTGKNDLAVIRRGSRSNSVKVKV
jgi:hypothetical protein